jgi:hypothetical protein
MSEDHSKDNSRSLSQSDEMKKNQMLADAGYNFNHFQNGKALFNKYNSKLNQLYTFSYEK